MNAKNNDLDRIREILSITQETAWRMADANITKEQFIHPQTSQEIFIAEGLMGRVLRVAEEASKLDEQIVRAYEIERHAISGLRNRLAHAYGEVDSEVVWDVLVSDFPALEDKLLNYLEDEGISF